MPTGMMPLAGSKGSLARTAAVAGYDEVWPSRVWPSGSALVTISVPIMPLAPGRLSTTMLRPSAVPRRVAMARLMASADPPGV